MLGWRESSSNPAQAQAEIEPTYFLFVQFPDPFSTAVATVPPEVFIGGFKLLSSRI